MFRAREEAYEGKTPYVGNTLCLPHVDLVNQERLAGEFKR